MALQAMCSLAIHSAVMNTTGICLWFPGMYISYYSQCIQNNDLCEPPNTCIKQYRGHLEHESLQSSVTYILTTAISHIPLTETACARSCTNHLETDMFLSNKGHYPITRGQYIETDTFDNHHYPYRQIIESVDSDLESLDNNSHGPWDYIPEAMHPKKPHNERMAEDTMRFKHISPMDPLSEPKSASEADRNSLDSRSESLFYDDGQTQYYRSKDAGTTCKERFSYSSFDAGATVLKASGGSQNSKAILVENKDTYMLMECADSNKHVIIELSDDILVDTVVLANFEFFSSMIRHFRVGVSDRYPVKFDKWWKDLGTFEAKNSRGIQSFLVNNPQIWAKYIRIEFLSHYGNEYYCPLSLIRIHGTRMMESWQDAERGDEDDDIGNEVYLGSHSEAMFDKLSKISDLLTEDNNTHHDLRYEQSTNLELHNASAICPTKNDLVSAYLSTFTCDAREYHLKVPEPIPSEKGYFEDSFQWSPYSRYSTPKTLASVISQPSGHSLLEFKLSALHIPSSQSWDLARPSTDTSHEAGDINNNSPTIPGSTASKTMKPRQPLATGSNPSLPIVQESFFKSISKRLQILETNVTMTMKSLDEKSRHINELLSLFERHLLSRVENVITEANDTLKLNVRSLHQEYSDTYRLILITLDRHRDQSEREIVELSSRLNLLADEVIFQKKMAFAQAALLLSCLVLVIFTRGATAYQQTPTEARVETSFSIPNRYSQYHEYASAHFCS